MHRRHWLLASMAMASEFALSGCRGSQFAKILHPGDKELVGSHQAGQETFKPLVEESVASLLARHCTPPATVQQVSMNGQEQLPPPAMRICFVAVENKSAEEIGDFKDQIYQVIDTRIIESRVFQPVNKRFVDAGLEQTRLRPDQLFVPQNMRAFTMAMEQAGQPFDFLLYATLTSGTTTTTNIVPTDAHSIAFARSFAAVLNIVYLNSTAAPNNGGFFPDGLNGAITSLVPPVKTKK